MEALNFTPDLSVKAPSNAARPFPRTGEIAIFANFTKSTSSFPPYFFCLFNLLRMVRLLHLKLLRETLRTVSKPTTQLCSRFSEGMINMLNTVLGARLLSWHFANGRLGLRTCHRNGHGIDCHF